MILSKVAVTRFSHDLAGVMSAVSNSLALLSELGGADAETMALATDSAESLLARLRFFRAAFGSDGPLTDVAVTRSLFENWLKSVENRATRFKCDWDVDGELPLFWFRLILLAGLVAAESLTRGGTISVVAKAGTKQASVEAVGAAVKADASVDAVLTGESGNVTPKTAAAAFIRGIMQEQNLTVEAKHSETSFTLKFKTA